MTPDRYLGDPDRRRLVGNDVGEMRTEREAAAGLAALAALRVRSPDVPEGAAERIEARIRTAWAEAFGP